MTNGFLMRVAVLGAGVIGVTSAYFLSRAGHDVTVIEQGQHVAAGASAQNGGQLSYSYTDALAGPALLKKLPGIVLGRDPALNINPPLDMHWLRWSLGFLRQCTAAAHRQNTASVQQLALRSQALMEDLVETTGITFDYRKAGKMVLLDSEKSCRNAEQSSAMKRDLGCEIELISWQEARQIDPALDAMTRPYAGVVFAQNDAVGDSQQFSRALANWLEEHSKTQFLLNTRVTAMGRAHHGKPVVQTTRGKHEADAIVVCLGSGCQQLEAVSSVSARIYPARGYSVTLPPGESPNTVSITDLSSKVVFSRLGERIRIAGFVDFVGNTRSRDSHRVRGLIGAAQRVAPKMADYEAPEIEAWGGFRPMTANSRPLLYKDNDSGLVYNAGHGMLGWTLACASGHEVAQLV